MSYPRYISSALKPYIDKDLNKTVIDLFAGCGGLSLGFEANGFKTIGYEMDENAFNTYNKNLIGDCFHEFLTTDFKYPKADIVIGGPPCQPFSVGGKQMGLKDSRDGFPVFIDAVKKVNPDLFLFENVRGMLYKNKWYLKEVVEALEDIGYNVTFSMLNAKHYEVPQNRERVFVIGVKGEFRFPKRSNRIITAGEALESMAFEAPPESKFLTKNMDEYIAKYEKASSCINPRDLHLDKPARTLTCRNLAGATGDMHRIRLKDGKRRRIFPREAARLQSFPDWFNFIGNETNVFNQIGNAVPPMLAYNIAKHIKENLITITTYSSPRKREKQLQMFQM